MARLWHHVLVRHEYFTKNGCTALLASSRFSQKVRGMYLQRPGSDEWETFSDVDLMIAEMEKA